MYTVDTACSYYKLRIIINPILHRIFFKIIYSKNSSELELISMWNYSGYRVRMKRKDRYFSDGYHRNAQMPG